MKSRPFRDLVDHRDRGRGLQRGFGRNVNERTFPTLMKVFNQSLNNVQWITTAYLLAVTLTIVLAAYLHRSFKFKSLIIAAGTASVIGGVICMLSNTLPVMLEVPRAKQGSFVGTAGMIVALAPSLGPTYGDLPGSS